MTEQVLLRAMAALADVRDRLVVVGGTAHRLFPLHRLGRNPGYDPLVTEDVDFAAPLELQHDGSRTLLDRLTQAGFDEEVRGATEPAYTYRLRGQESAYLEFIADLTGSGTKRSGEKDNLMRFSGIHAEKLRHVGVLLHAPWEVDLESSGTTLRMRIANPSAYLLQKLLTLESRPANKRAKDMLYIFDTLAIFSDSLRELGAHAAALLPPLPPKDTKRASRAASLYCVTEGAATYGAAVSAAGQRERPPTSAQIAAACEIGLPRVLPGVLLDH